MLKFSDVKIGDKLIADEGFTCIPDFAELVIEGDADGPFFRCHGVREDKRPGGASKHYLVGQLRGGYLVGLERAP